MVTRILFEFEDDSIDLKDRPASNSPPPRNARKQQLLPRQGSLKG
jgi:hypothetical protein